MVNTFPCSINQNLTKYSIRSQMLREDLIEVNIACGLVTANILCVMCDGKHIMCNGPKEMGQRSERMKWLKE